MNQIQPIPYDPSIPLTFSEIQFETIQGCNRKCWHCPNRTIPSTGATMPEDLIDKILTDLEEMDYRGSVRPYLMNEPFLDPRMPAIMAEIRQRLPKAFCVVNTNGQLLPIATAKKLNALGVKLRISAYEPEILRAFWPLRGRYLHVTDLTGISQDSTPEVFYNRAGMVEGLGSGPTSGPCYYPFAQLYIRHDGRAVLCCSDYRSQVVMGNVRARKLLTVFNSAIYKRYRTQLSQGKRLGPLCSKCNVPGHLTKRKG